jgi:hypothetical protein
MKHTAKDPKEITGHDQSGRTEAAALNQAVRAAFRIYEYRELEHNLKAFGWRGARRRALGNGALSGEWVGRGGCEVRLIRRGLEVHFPGEEIRLLGWQQLWEHARERGS